MTTFAKPATDIMAEYKAKLIENPFLEEGLEFHKRRNTITNPYLNEGDVVLSFYYQRGTTYLAFKFLIPITESFPDDYINAWIPAGGQYFCMKNCEETERNRQIGYKINHSTDNECCFGRFRVKVPAEGYKSFFEARLGTYTLKKDKSNQIFYIDFNERLNKETQ